MRPMGPKSNSSPVHDSPRQCVRRKAEGIHRCASLIHCWSAMTNSILFYRNSHGKPVRPKGNQSWIFVGRTDAEAEAPIILWPPDAKSRLIGKDSDAGKDWRQEEKGVTEDEMVGWHHRLTEHEFEQALRHGEGQGSLVCCSPWGHKVRNDWVTKKQKQQQMVIFESSIGRVFTLIIITTVSELITCAGTMLRDMYPFSP